MKIRKILLITFMLLAVLAVGAVSAADEIASDNMTVTNEATLDSVAVTDEDGVIVEDDTIASKYDEERYHIQVNEEINVSNKDMDIAGIYLPPQTKGQFRMYKWDELMVDIDVSRNVDEESDIIAQYIEVSDILNFNYDFRYGDKIAFKFYENVDGNLELDDAFSLYYKVTGEFGSNRILSKINASEMTNIAGYIEVNSTNTTTPNENFAYVHVDTKDGTFIIKAIDDLGSEFEIFRDNLKNTTKPHWILDEGNGKRFLRFGFNFNDINKFLKNNNYGTFLVLVEREVICENYIIFMLLKNDEKNTVEDYRPMLFNISSDGIMSFKDNTNIDPSLSISIANITEGTAANIVVSTNKKFTGNVSVKIGDKNYTVSVTKGTGTLPVTGLAIGTYNATAVFKANAFFKESTINTTFAVNPKVATSLTAPAVTTTYSTSKNIVVTLKDADGNPLDGKDVVITFNGASKTIKTDDEGHAVLAVGTKLAPGKYDATFKFAGDSNYLASAGTVKVTVNKAKPKLTAKKKTFKRSLKTKKYAITLKSGKAAIKKVQVTLKIKGKTFKAKTNAKGKAVFKIKKLSKKGKFKATIKFKGNKYYNAVTKKVLITIK